MRFLSEIAPKFNKKSLEVSGKSLPNIMRAYPLAPAVVVPLTAVAISMMGGGSIGRRSTFSPKPHILECFGCCRITRRIVADDSRIAGFTCALADDEDDADCDWWAICSKSAIWPGCPISSACCR